MPQINSASVASNNYQQFENEPGEEEKKEEESIVENGSNPPLVRGLSSNAFS